MNHLVTIISPSDPDIICTGVIWDELTLDKIKRMVEALHSQLAPHYQACNVDRYVLRIVPYTY